MKSVELEEMWRKRCDKLKGEIDIVKAHKEVGEERHREEVGGLRREIEGLKAKIEGLA